MKARNVKHLRGLYLSRPAQNWGSWMLLDRQNRPITETGVPTGGLKWEFALGGGFDFVAGGVGHTARQFHAILGNKLLQQAV